MESFCHRLPNPEVCLHVAKSEKKYLTAIYICRKGAQCYDFEIDLDERPEAAQLLKPCAKIVVQLYGKKISIKIDGVDIVKNVTVDDLLPQQALIQISEAYSKKSAAISTTANKQKDAKGFKKEALDLLMKIEQQREEEFAKYVLLLNEKKKKIRELQAQLGVPIDEQDVEDYGLEVSDEPVIDENAIAENDDEAGSSKMIEDKTVRDEGSENEEELDEDQELSSDEHSEKETKVEEIDDSLEEIVKTGRRRHAKSSSDSEDSDHPNQSTKSKKSKTNLDLLDDLL